MAYEDINTMNISSLSKLFVVISTNVPIFIPLMLTALFFIVFLANMYAQERTKGYSNKVTCFATAGFLTAVVSIMLSLVPNLVNPFVVIVCIVIAVIGAGALLTRGSEG